MLIIAERINSSRKKISEAIEARDAVFIQKEAVSQAQSGADYIDVNAGSLPDEVESLKWLVEVVQDVTEIPLCLDSADPEVIAQVIPLVKATPMINSFTLEPGRLDSVLSLAADHGAKVIGLCQSGEMMGTTFESKMVLARQMVDRVTGFGIALKNLYIDPLIFPVGTDTHSAVASLKAISTIMSEFPGVHTVCGLTNVSHGLPCRRLINRTFLVCALTSGLDTAILDPTDDSLYSGLRAAAMLLGHDDYCMDFISSYRKGRLELAPE